MKMKTPEEIKKGLKLCSHEGHGEEIICQHCPYDNNSCPVLICTSRLSEDALAYIQQLESRLAQVERERDAAVRAISDAKHYIKDLGAISYGLQQLENWDYSIKKSGVFEENAKEEEK